MLELAEKRLERFDNVELRLAELESLPLDDNSVDASTLILVLHHLERPELAVHEAARVLKPTGRLLIVDILPHDRAEYRMEKGHVWLGFSENEIDEYLTAAGFESIRFQHLPPAPEAKGPNLFAVSARTRRE